PDADASMSVSVLSVSIRSTTEWLVDHDADVAAGAVVLRIETDKTETDIEASASGRLQLIGAVGETYACGELIGWFLGDGESTPGGGASATAAGPATAGSSRSTPNSALTSDAAAPTGAPAAPAPTPAGGRVFASPNARRVAAARGIDLTGVTGSGPGGRIVSEDLDGVDTPARQPTKPTSPDDRRAAPEPRSSVPPSVGSVTATAAARQLADLLGLDLSTVDVDPADGRVTREAVARHVRTLLAASSEPASSASPSLPPATQEPTEVVAFTGMRGAIASRMHGSLQQMAQLSLFMDADADAITADRARRKEMGARVPTYTDYVVAAATRALTQHGRVNSQVTDDGIALLPEVHIGLAVAVDDGLVVPVIRNTAHRDLIDLAAESSRLAEAARSGSLGFTDFEGGTFAVTTLGVYGVDGFTPVINPPNAAILGVGRVRDDVVVRDGQLDTAARVTLSLTWDHRVFDGALAAEFTRTVAQLLQRPADLDQPLG
ncbi:MAG: dihydrolipoamide acetyltransferase family protein, partial [Actinomycetota bacterium]